MHWTLHAAIGLLCAATPTAAADLGSINDFDVRWDTTLRGSVGARLEGKNPALLSNPNADDGDRAFKPGIVSERMDFTTQIDVSRGDLGFDASADGWYDAIYHLHDANQSAATFNPISVPVNQFPADVRRLMGATVELGNAYVHDKFDLGGLPVTIRVGRQTLLWGESLFFPEDGIAAAQAPVDVIKQISQPLVENREVYLPVAQADIRISLPYSMSFEAFDQFEWRRDRTPGVASYFSTSDVLDIGGERAFVPGGGVLYRGKDSTPTGIGQFGAALRRSSDVVDLGLYAIRYDAKDPQITTLNQPPGMYQAVFPSGIDLLGVSASTYLGEDTLAGELSERWHMPLVSRGITSLAGSNGPFAGPSVASPAGEVYAGYATGETLQALVSFERQLRRGPFWQGAILDAEIAATDLLGIETNRDSRFSGATKLASAFEAVFTPQYFQVRPGLDVTVPVGIQWGLSGRSSSDPGMVSQTGNVTLSASATYQTVWQGSISYTHFIGSPHLQPLADRDFVIVTLARTF